MLDGRFDPDLHRFLSEGRVSAEDLAREDQDDRIGLMVSGLWLAALAVAVLLCRVPLS